MNWLPLGRHPEDRCRRHVAACQGRSQSKWFALAWHSQCGHRYILTDRLMLRTSALPNTVVKIGLGEQIEPGVANTDSAWRVPSLTVPPRGLCLFHCNPGKRRCVVRKAHNITNAKPFMCASVDLPSGHRRPQRTPCASSKLKRPAVFAVDSLPSEPLLRARYALSLHSLISTSCWQSQSNRSSRAAPQWPPRQALP